MSRFVHQYDDEYEEVKKTRRPGRPASTREDLLKMKIAALEKEHRDGFCELSPFPLAPHVD
jgi:translation machinery-associated protein 16